MLVASPETLRRPNVRQEWQRARGQGKRIIVAHWRGLRVPKELAGCESVDFRGAFRPALDKLISRLERNPETAGFVERTCVSVSSPRLPPWIIAISAALVIPLLRCGILSSAWGSAQQSASHIGAFAYFVSLAVVLLTAWYLGLSFLRRRMGMTQLVTCLTLVFVACDAVEMFLFLALSLSSSVGRYLALRYWSGLLLPGAVPLAGLAIVLLIRPEDLLRWAPTGKAWDWYRARCGARFPTADGSPVFEQITRYRLFCDPVDLPAAHQLRRIFAGLNALETEDSENATSVLLLTNRTRTEWLIQQTWEQQESKVLIVVGTGIGLGESVEWVWRRQWIDFRRWDLKRVDRQRELLQVPEAMASPRFPVRVRLAHHLLCALGTLFFLLPDIAASQPGQQFSAESPWRQVADSLADIAACSAFILCVVLARRLLRRRVSEVGFFRTWPMALAAMSAGLVTSFYTSPPNSISPVGLFAAAAFLVAFPAWMLWNRRKLAFWFPLPGSAHAKKAEALTANRNWQTLIWLSVCMVFWVLTQIRF